MNWQNVARPEVWGMQFSAITQVVAVVLGFIAAAYVKPLLENQVYPDQQVDNGFFPSIGRLLMVLGIVATGIGTYLVYMFLVANISKFAHATDDQYMGDIIWLICAGVCLLISLWTVLIINQSVYHTIWQKSRRFREIGRWFTYLGTLPFGFVVALLSSVFLAQITHVMYLGAVFACVIVVVLVITKVGNFLTFR